MKRTIKEIETEIDTLWDKIQELREEKSNLKIAEHNFIGKYVKVKEHSYEEDFSLLMYVYEMFPVQNEKVLLRGVGFKHFETVDWDGSYFDWWTDCDTEVEIYKLATSVAEITEEEYNDAFNDAMSAFLKHKKEIVDIDMKKWAESNKKD